MLRLTTIGLGAILLLISGFSCASADHADATPRATTTGAAPLELPDQVPGALPDPLSITLETVDGNHIILDLGNGVYAFYAHLRIGSVLVEEGARVTAGRELARLGNSGNTSGPHLHLHLMTRPSAIVSDGIPYVFNRFQVQGAIDEDQWFATDELDGTWTIVDVDEPGCHARELPLTLRVVRFSGLDQRGCRSQP